ncbi:MAG: peptidyl-prolyl cis-trans isomerase [Acidobacteriota bacterium]
MPVQLRIPGPPYTQAAMAGPPRPIPLLAQLLAAAFASVLVAQGGLARAEALPESAMLSAPENAVATWNGGAVDPGTYLRWLRYRGYDDTPVLAGEVRQLVLVEALSAAAMQGGLERSPGVARELAAARDRWLALAYENQVRGSVTVDDAEIDALLSERPDAFRRPKRWRLRRIQKSLGDDPTSTRRAMARLRADLSDGADFSALARRESEAPDAGDGGRMGLVTLGQLPPELAAAVGPLGPGDVTEVLQTGNVLVILRCDSVVGGSAPEDAEVRKRLRANLAELKASEDWRGVRRELLAASRFSPEAFADGADAVVMRIADRTWSATEVGQMPGAPSGLNVEEAEAFLAELAIVWGAARRGEARGLDRRPAVLEALGWQRLEILAVAELEKRLEREREAATEEDVRAYVRGNPERFVHPPSWRLSVLRTPPGDVGLAAARAARDAVERTVPFTQVARETSDHRSADGGGRLPWLGAEALERELGPETARVARRLRPGEVSKPISTDAGHWLLKLDDLRPERPQTLDEASPRARRELEARRLDAARSRLRDRLLDELDLDILLETTD